MIIIGAGIPSASISSGEIPPLGFDIWNNCVEIFNLSVQTWDIDF